MTIAGAVGGAIDFKAGLDPDRWRDWALAPTAVASRPTRFTGAFLQCWRDTSPAMRQPALDHHMIVLHQGGPKRVHREGRAGRRSVDVPLHAITTVEAGSAYRWRTDGPIAFSHIYVAPGHFAAVVGEAFDRDPATINLAEAIGQVEPHAANLFDLIIASRHDPDWAAVGDFYLDALLVRLAVTLPGVGEFRAEQRLALTHHTVARVRDFVRANLDRAVTLDAMAAVAGYSRYHFVRAFKASTGLPPYGYLLEERVAAAQDLLRSTDTPIAEVARRTGFATHTHFSTRFRRATGMTPMAYRRLCRGTAPHNDDAAAFRTPAPAARHNAG